MSADIAKAYFELQRLREEVHKAELDQRVSVTHLLTRPRLGPHTRTRADQAINRRQPDGKGRVRASIVGGSAPWVAGLRIPVTRRSLN